MIIKKMFLIKLVFILIFVYSCSNDSKSQSKANFDFDINAAKKVDVPLLDYYTRGSVNENEVTIRVKGKTPDMDIAHTFEAGYGSQFPIFGLYADYLNKVEITDNGETMVLEIQTDPLPEGIDNAVILTDNLPQADPFNQDLFWTSERREEDSNFKMLVGYDRKGDIRYYLSGYNSVNMFEEDGKIYIKTPMEVLSIEGDIVFEARKGRGYHHDILRFNNGNYASLATSKFGVQDRFIEQTPDAAIVKDKNFGSLFRDVVSPEDLELLNKIINDNDSRRKDENGNDISDDWLHCNSLVYDEDTDIMYVSSRHQAVFAFNYSEWKLLWWMADDTLRTKHLIVDGSINFTDVPSLDRYRVKGAAATDGPKNQHALLLFKNGNLGMMDNAGDEEESTKGSRYVEYKITGELGSFTATKVREYEDPSLYSQTRSDIDFTADGNLLMLYANINRIQEVDIDNGNRVVFDLHSKASEFIYRMAKMPLYPYQDSNKKYSIGYNEKEEN